MIYIVILLAASIFYKTENPSCDGFHDANPKCQLSEKLETDK